MLENGSEEIKRKLISDISQRKDFISMAENPTKLKQINSGRLASSGNPDTDDDVSDLLSSDLLSTVVNSEGIVGIGSYIFNVNLVTEKCYALHTIWYQPNGNKVKYYNLLNETSNNNYIFEFSTDTDVLDILEGSGNPMTKDQIDSSSYATRNCGGVEKKKDNGTEYFPRYDANTRDRVECKVVYQKAGIYFALLGKLLFKANGQGNWQSRTDWFQWKFKPKCKDEKIQAYTTNYTTNAGNGYKKYAYESTRGLSKFDVQFQWEIKGHLATSNSFLKTRVYAIKAGY